MSPRPWVSLVLSIPLSPETRWKNGLFKIQLQCQLGSNILPYWGRLLQKAA